MIYTIVFCVSLGSVITAVFLRWFGQTISISYAQFFESLYMYQISSRYILYFYLKMNLSENVAGDYLLMIATVLSHATCIRWSDNNCFWYWFLQYSILFEQTHQKGWFNYNYNIISNMYWFLSLSFTPELSYIFCLSWKIFFNA